MRDWVHFRNIGGIRQHAQRLADAQSTRSRPVTASTIFRELFLEARDARIEACGGTHSAINRGICTHCGTVILPTQPATDPDGTPIATSPITAGQPIIINVP